VTQGFSEFVLDGDAGAGLDLLGKIIGSDGGSIGSTGDGQLHRVRRTWLDSFDWRLYRAGMSLEQVSTGGSTVLVLTDRDGETLAAHPLPARGKPGAVSWPSLLGALPPGALRELLEPVIGVRALAPVARAVSEVTQRCVLNSDDKTVARIGVDEMSVSYPARVQAPARVSVSAIRGYQRQADRVSRALARESGVRPARMSPLYTALTAVGHQPGGRSAVVKLRPDMPAAAALAAILTRLLDTAEENVPGIVRDVDTEFLHDLRVAVRRTRSALKLTGTVLPDDLVVRFRPEFKWLADLTTPARDLDVHLLGFDALAASLAGGSPEDLEPLRAHLLRARASAHRGLVRGLRSVRFSRLAGDWRSELAGVRRGRRHPVIAEVAARRIAAAQRRALRAGQRITAASPPAHLHELRKDCKELRYLIEMFGSLYDAQRSWQAVRDLKVLQDCLGDFQDAEVQDAEIRAFADRMLAERSAPAATLLAMGEIAADLVRRQRAARAAFDARFAAFASPASQARLAALTEASWER
jgi:CHAD domain-containing protein